MAVRAPAGRVPPARVEVAAVFAGGAVGALARTVLAEHWQAGGAAWPWATLVANVAGAFLLGAVAAAFGRDPGRPGVPRAALGTGLCGALTTFSTLQLELVLMLRDGAAGRALAYATVTLAMGLAAVWLGDRLVRRRIRT